MPFLWYLSPLFDFATSIEFGDFGFAELFLLNKKYLVKRRQEKVCIL
jgi:hypothetical protein